MSNGVLDLEDLEDFFERGFSVTSQSEGAWAFTASSGRFAGYSVTFEGAGLLDADANGFPDAGSISHITIMNGATLVADHSGLNLSVADLLEEIDFEGEDDDDDDDSGDDVFGGDDDDDLDGRGGDDHISGGGGNDDLHGRGGHDDLTGDDGDDHVSGGAGADDLTGGTGNDDVTGGRGRDHLSGDAGEDVLHGGKGKDILDGGADDDRLIGGGGSNVFRFSPDFGTDHISRFVAGHDEIDLSATGLSFADLSIENRYNEVVINSGQGTIIIDSLTGTLDRSDFQF